MQPGSRTCGWQQPSPISGCIRASRTPATTPHLLPLLVFGTPASPLLLTAPACCACCALMLRRISDPAMGGAYLTLLNTLANVGVTVPKLFVFTGAWAHNKQP